MVTGNRRCLFRWTRHLPGASVLVSTPLVPPLSINLTLLRLPGADFSWIATEKCWLFFSQSMTNSRSTRTFQKFQDSRCQKHFISIKMPPTLRCACTCLQDWTHHWSFQLSFSNMEENRSTEWKIHLQQCIDLHLVELSVQTRGPRLTLGVRSTSYYPTAAGASGSGAGECRR